MTVTYQLTEAEFDYQLFRSIKAQFARRNDSFKIKETETDETEAILANPVYCQELLRRKASVKAKNVVSFTPSQFDELIQKHSIWPENGQVGIKKYSSKLLN